MSRGQWGRRLKTIASSVSRARAGCRRCEVRRTQPAAASGAASSGATTASQRVCSGKASRIGIERQVNRERESADRILQTGAFLESNAARQAGLRSASRASTTIAAWLEAGERSSCATARTATTFPRRPRCTCSPAMPFRVGLQLPDQRPWARLNSKRWTLAAGSITMMRLTARKPASSRARARRADREAFLSAAQSCHRGARRRPQRGCDPGTPRDQHAARNGRTKLFP